MIHPERQVVVIVCLVVSGKDPVTCEDDVGCVAEILETEEAGNADFLQAA